MKITSTLVFIALVASSFCVAEGCLFKKSHEIPVDVGDVVFPDIESINGTSTLTCRGSGCFAATITGCDRVLCIGSFACSGATIINASYVACQGDHACRSAAMNLAKEGLVECNGGQGECGGAAKYSCARAVFKTS